MNDRTNKKRGARNAERGAAKPATRADRTAATQATDAAQAVAQTATDPATEPFIRKAEVARRLGRTLRTVDKLMRRGRIPYYKFDWRVAFRWSEVQAHLAETCRVCRSREVAR